ncbi:hypothetical protein [Mitsuaria sp. GD03876]|uniref:hypothetical protein n=1 Tax=Mitsuaria sp. GD03876 TaxID=2975399 RepID=UPI00244A9702|nr:hypothetical protein [Mitsuaria sp. GD03876]MDH0865686.1 hypothetical protein [Mitsuaria sp. GD03876]
MKTLFKTLLILGLVLVLGATLLGWGVVHLVGDVPGVHLTIDGDEVIWSGLGLADAFGAGLGMIIAIGVMCLVVPLILLLGLGLPLLILGALALAGIAALLGVGAVVGSPLILIGFIVWLLVRDKPRKSRAAASPVAPPAPLPAAPAEPSLHA